MNKLEHKRNMKLVNIFVSRHQKSDTILRKLICIKAKEFKRILIVLDTQKTEYIQDAQATLQIAYSYILYIDSYISYIDFYYPASKKNLQNLHKR